MAIRIDLGSIKKELMPGIDSGKYDLVIAYGTTELENPVKNAPYKVDYHPMSFLVRLALVCHPSDRHLVVRESHNNIKDQSTYDELIKEKIGVELKNINIHKMVGLHPGMRVFHPLSNWSETGSVLNFLNTIRDPERVVEVRSSNECLFYARTGQGIGIVTEAFVHSPGVSAFPIIMPEPRVTTANHSEQASNVGGSKIRVFRCWILLSFGASDKFSNTLSRLFHFLVFFKI